MVSGVAFSPDGTLLATMSTDGITKLWQVTDSVLMYIAIAGVADLASIPTWAVAFSPAGMTLATGGGGKVSLWNTEELVPEGALATGSKVWTVAFSPDGTMLAAGCADGNVRLWYLPTMRQIALLPGGSGNVNSVAFSPAGDLLAAGSSEGSVRLWVVPAGLEVETLTGHTGPIFSVAFSPDGRLLATASRDRTVRLWT